MPFQGLIFRMKKLFQYSTVVFLIFGYSLHAQEELDLYKILGISNTADIHQINQAYRQQLSELYSSEDPSLEKLERISIAFEVLRDPELRTQYDQGRLGPLDTGTLFKSQGVVKRVSETVRDSESGIYKPILRTETVEKIYQRVLDRVSETVRDSESGIERRLLQTEDSKSSLFKGEMRIIPLQGKIRVSTGDGKIENMEGRWWGLFERETTHDIRGTHKTIHKPASMFILFENSKGELFFQEGRNIRQVFDPPQPMRDIGHWLEDKLQKWRNRQSISKTSQDSTIPRSQALIPAETTQLAEITQLKVEIPTIVQELLQSKVLMPFGEIQSWEFNRPLIHFGNLWETVKDVYGHEGNETVQFEYLYRDGKIVEWKKTAPNSETPIIELEIQRDSDNQRIVNKTITDKNGHQRVEHITQYQDPFITPEGNVVEGRQMAINPNGQVQEIVRQRETYPNPLAEKEKTSSVKKLRTMIQNFPGKLSKMYQDYRRSSLGPDRSSSASAEEWVTVEEDREMSEKERAERERVSPLELDKMSRAETINYFHSVMVQQSNLKTSAMMGWQTHKRFPLETIAFYTSIGALMWLTSSSSPNPINTLLEQTTSSVGLWSFYFFVLASGVTSIGFQWRENEHGKKTNRRLEGARSRFSAEEAESIHKRHERFVKRLRFLRTPLSLTAGMYASTVYSEWKMDPDYKACEEGLANPNPDRGYNFIDSCQTAYNNWTIPRKIVAHLPDLYSLILAAVIANKGFIPLLTLAGRQLIKLKQITWRKWLKKEIKKIKPSELPGKVAGGPMKILVEVKKWIVSTLLGAGVIELVKSIGRFLPFLYVIEVLHPWTVNIKKYGLFRDIIDQRQKLQNDFNSMLNWNELPKEECILKEDPRTITKDVLWQHFRQKVDELEEGLWPSIQNFLDDKYVDCPESDIRDGLDYYSTKMKELRFLYLTSFFEEVQLWMNRIQETLLSYEMSKNLAFNLYEYKKTEQKYLAKIVDIVDLIQLPVPHRLSKGTYSIGQIEAYRNIVNRPNIKTPANQSVVENKESEEAVPTEENQEEAPVHPETMEIDQAYPFYGIGAEKIISSIEKYGYAKAIRDWINTLSSESGQAYREINKAYGEYGLRGLIRVWSDHLTLEDIQPYLDSAVAYLEKRGVPTADPYIVSQAVSRHFPYEYFNPHSSISMDSKFNTDYTNSVFSLIKTLLSCKSGVSDCVKHISAGVDLLVQTISNVEEHEQKFPQIAGKYRRDEFKDGLYTVRNLLVCKRKHNCSSASRLKAYPLGLFWFETQKTGIQGTILGHREYTREDSFFPYLFDSFEEDHTERIFYQMACGNDLKDYEPDMNLKINEISEDHIEELPLYEEHYWGGRKLHL